MPGLKSWQRLASVLRDKLAAVARIGGGQALGTDDQQMLQALEVEHKEGRGKRRARHRIHMCRTVFRRMKTVKYTDKDGRVVVLQVPREGYYKPHEGHRQRARQRGKLKQYEKDLALWKQMNPDRKPRDGKDTPSR